MPLDILPCRFQDKIRVDEITGCWEWTGWNSGNGYGKLSFQGKIYMAHRYMFELYYGSIPDGYVLDHLCKNRCCCNPTHLELVTPKENVYRGDTILFKKVS